MNNEEHFQEIKEKEITRLTTPISYPKIGNFTFRVVGAKDCEGNPVPMIRGFRNRFTLEPKPGILSDDEILMYAPESKESSRIRLKRGIGTQSDKSAVNGDLIYVVSISLVFLFVFSFIILILGNLTIKLLFALIILILIGSYIYVMYIKDYIEPEYKSTPIKEKPPVEEKLSETDNLFLLFESKEKIAREMIEKKFPAPQLTNSKFNAVLDNCRSVVESQMEVLNSLTPTEKTKPEIDSRKKLIKRLISKMDDLTNELILSEENNIEDVIGDMDNLINSVKDYE